MKAATFEVLLLRRGAADQPFETFDAPERQQRTGVAHGAGDRERLLQRAGAGASAHDSTFKQQLQRPADLAPCRGFAQARHALQRIDQAVEIEGRIGMRVRPALHRSPGAP